MAEPLLEVKDLHTTFRTDGGVVRAVDGVSFTVNRGEVFAIVGESGSGKSVTAMSILGLIPEPPGKIEGGEILWKGQDLRVATDREMQKIRGQEISMIFQDPMTSLNPVFTVGQQIAEIIRIHGTGTRAVAQRRALEMMKLVGIPNPSSRVDDYPHQFSGGMRQRVMIAMAIACSPELLIADEPTTALDVTIQAQILEVLQQAAAEVGSSIILITHDLGVVAGVAERVAVMYAGQIVEQGDVEQIFYAPRMPYTWGLLESIARLDQERVGRLRPITGAPPDMARPPSGCRFHPRCPYADARCPTQMPELAHVNLGLDARCLYAGEPGWLSPVERMTTSPHSWDERITGFEASQGTPGARVEGGRR